MTSSHIQRYLRRKVELRMCASLHLRELRINSTLILNSMNPMAEQVNLPWGILKFIITTIHKFNVRIIATTQQAFEFDSSTRQLLIHHSTRVNHSTTDVILEMVTKTANVFPYLNANIFFTAYNIYVYFRKLVGFFVMFDDSSHRVFHQLEYHMIQMRRNVNYFNRNIWLQSCKKQSPILALEFNEATFMHSNGT